VEIVPGLHEVRLLGSKGYLAEGDGGLTLIDAGMRGSGLLLKRYLARIGRPTDDIARIVCTHGHPDHIGGVREIAAFSGLEILLHPADAERLRIGIREVIARPAPGPVVALLTKGPEDAKPVEDGEVIPALGGLAVVHTPGHTPGSICLYSARYRLLIVGDVLQVIRGQLTLPSQFFTEDMALARRSIQRLAELDVETICFAHYATWESDGGVALRELAAACAPS
jgi:glyoxylase-like metal-dependent hydrolase (beta-lactamase superfamily II)